MKYELWEFRDNRIETYSFFAVDENYAKQIEQLEPNAKLIWSVDADSYNKAMCLYYKKMGWGDYKSLE